MFRKITICVSASLLFTVNIIAQTWPVEMRLSQDSTLLTIGGAPAAGFYNDSVVRSLYLTFPQPDYWQLMQANYASKTDIPATLVVDGVTYDSVGVRFKGQTSYMMNSTSQKKSFNISTDYAHNNQELMGYKTLNLNNAFQDASFMREVFFQHQIRKHIPAAKSNFVKLYINGANWGVYPNVQQLNKTFLKEWFLTNNGSNWRADSETQTGGGGGGGGPQWGDGTAALNYLGNDTAGYQQYYTLKSSDETNPWDILRIACEVLDTVSDAHMEDVLNQFYDVDRVLWYLASEIAFADDDGYAYKGKMDYYVYHEAETGRMTPLEYDGNSVMKSNNASWSPFYHADNVNYPLLNKLLNNTTLRQRYLAHMRTIIEEEFNVTESNARLDWYKALIDTMVQNDPKKTSTYNQFNTEVTALKNFIQTRRTNLLADTEVAQVAPVISDASHYAGGNVQWAKPSATEQVYVKANVASSDGIEKVQLYYSTDIVGKFTKTLMYDDGLHDDAAAGDGIFAAMIPAQPAGTWVRWYVEATSANAFKSVAYLPAGAEHNVFVYQVRGNATSVASNNVTQSVQLFPNPASDVVYVKVSGVSNALVDVVNAVGQVVISEKPSDDLIAFNTATIPAGIYFVRCGSAVKKLVIAR